MDRAMKPDESKADGKEQQQENDLTSIPSSQPRSNVSEQAQRSTGGSNYYRDQVSGYVQNVTKTNHSSAKNCDYFNAVLQTDEGVYSELVCLEPTKKRAFEEAAEEQTPLQLENVYRSPSKLKKYSDVIKFGSPSKEIKTSVDFAYHPIPKPEPKPDAPFIDIKDITLICDLVSIKAYINIDNRPIVSVQLPYKNEPVDKKDCWANDATGAIPLALWGVVIDQVKASGTYRVINAKVKMFNGKLSLTTNTSTKVRSDETDVAPSLLPTDQQASAVKFPPSRVINLQRKYFCKSCNKFRDSASPNPNLFACSTCKAVSSTVRLRKRISALLEFEDVKVRFGGNQVEEYFKKLGTAVPEDDDAISIGILQDCNSIMLYDSHNFCIGFK